MTLLGLWTATAAGAAAAGCKVVYTVGSQWGGGFTANVAITNLGDALSGWRLNWTFAASQSVTQAWGATVTSSGAEVTAANASWNGSLGTNGTASFGFNGSWTGSNPVPAGFALNVAGRLYSGEPEGVVRAGYAPTPE